MTELAYKSENDLFFEGENFDEKMDWYDDLDPNKPEDALKLRAGQKFSYLVTMWFLNRISSWEDFYEVDSEKS